MICAYSSICEKCYCCCKYFSTYLAFLLEMIQLVTLIFLIILTATSEKAQGLLISAIVFNCIHNIVTCLIADFRGNSGADELTLNSLLCCYICCPNCGSCCDMILGIFNCSCIVGCIDGCFDSYPRLMILVVVQIVSGVLTFALGFQGSNEVGDTNKFSTYVGICLGIFIGFAAFNYFLNIICFIHYLVQNCSCKKEPVYNEQDSSDKEDQSPNSENDNNNGQIIQPQYFDGQQYQPDPNNNAPPLMPNQNQYSYTPQIAMPSNNDNSKVDGFDPENPNGSNQQGELNQGNT